MQLKPFQSKFNSQVNQIFDKFLKSHLQNNHLDPAITI